MLPVGPGGPTVVLLVVRGASGLTVVHGCGVHREVSDGLAVVLVPPGARPCRLAVERDDHAALVASAPLTVHGPIALGRAALPPFGAVASPGFVLAPAGAVARVVPLHHAPRAPGEPHPAWLHALPVTAVNGVPVAGLDRWQLLDLVQGPAGGRLRVTFPCDPFSAGTCPAAAFDLVFTRSAPVPWVGGRPPGDLVRAWVADHDLPPEAVHAALLTSARAAGTTPP